MLPTCSPMRLWLPHHSFHFYVTTLSSQKALKPQNDKHLALMLSIKLKWKSFWVVITSEGISRCWEMYGQNSSAKADFLLRKPPNEQEVAAINRWLSRKIYLKRKSQALSPSSALLTRTFDKIIRLSIHQIIFWKPVSRVKNRKGKVRYLNSSFKTERSKVGKIRYQLVLDGFGFSFGRLRFAPLSDSIALGHRSL